jgi:hypothetical protein
MNEFPDTGSQGQDRDDERLRRLLDETVSDVEPREALGSIHARTKVTPMKRRRSWLLGAGAAVVATAATVAAVTVLGSDGTTGGPGREVAGPAASPKAGTSEGASPSDQPTKDTTPTEKPSATESVAPTVEAVPVYYVGDTSRGPRLYREFHRVDTAGNPLEAAVREAVVTRPDDPDYRTDWPAGTAVDTSFDGIGNGGQISIELYNESTDLRERPAGMSAEQADLAVEQLIYTAQAAAQVRAPVQFYLARQGSSENRTDTLLGVPVSEPLAQGSAEDVLAQVWVIEPAEDARVTSPFEVSGLAAAFEANVQWELKQGDRVVERGFTTAKECCTMAPYSFTVKAPPGDYTLVVHDTDASGGEGFAPWEDTKRVTVVP